METGGRLFVSTIIVALSLRMKIWNIGSDGQFLMGAFAAVGIGAKVDMPHWLLLIVMALAAAAAGAAWILIPALARAYWGVNEIITTLLLNFVALQLVLWASLGFWRDKKSQVTQSTEPVPAAVPASPARAVQAATGNAGDADSGSLEQFRLSLISAARRYRRYPPQAMERGWQGRVEVRLVIGANGITQIYTVKTSSGFTLLDRKSTRLNSSHT